VFHEFRFNFKTEITFKHLLNLVLSCFCHSSALHNALELHAIISQSMTLKKGQQLASHVGIIIFA